MNKPLFSYFDQRHSFKFLPSCYVILHVFESISNGLSTKLDDGMITHSWIFNSYAFSLRIRFHNSDSFPLSFLPRRFILWIPCQRDSNLHEGIELDPRWCADWESDPRIPEGPAWICQSHTPEHDASLGRRHLRSWRVLRSELIFSYSSTRF